MERKFYSTFKSRLIFGKYSIKYLISKGSFGAVYLGTNIINGKNYALKVEKIKSGILYLKNECYILLNLKGPGIPSVISYGVSDNYNILVENLLGKSIWDIWLEKKSKFNLKDICLFAIQAISLLEYVHSKNYLHCDIKPANFLVGNPDNSQLYLIDFGNAKKFRSSKTGKHIIYMKTKFIKGALLFLSMNILKGIETTRKDELESLGLVIIYLFLGKLPWSNAKFYSIKDVFVKIATIRNKISNENLCKGMPKEMNDYMNYVMSLNYEQCPNYEYLRNLFRSVLGKIGESNEELFSWVDRNKYRTITSKRSASKSKKRNIEEMFQNLLKTNTNKLNINQNKKKQLNNNVEKMKKNPEMKGIGNINIKKNSSIYNSKLNSINCEKYQKININIPENFKNDIHPKNENIKTDFNQDTNKKNLNKKLPQFQNFRRLNRNLILSNFDKEIKTQKLTKNKNPNNIYDASFPKEQNKYERYFDINHFNTTVNLNDKTERRIRINTTNINNTRNNKSNINAKIEKNNETQKLLIKMRNRINQTKTIINNFSTFEQTLCNYYYRPRLYKPICPNEFSSNIYLSLYELNLNKFKITPSEKNFTQSNSLNKTFRRNENDVSQFTLHNFKVNKYSFPKTKLYRAKFFNKNSLKNIIINLNNNM